VNFKLITVGIADLGVAAAPDILRTILGSCVGVCIHDPLKSIAGLSHIMLPVMNDKSSNDKKYADTAIPMLLKDMERAGADRRRVIAKIVGGATMFKISENSMMGEIGRKNVQKVREVLAGLGIAISAEDVGGDYGRTIDFYAADGALKIKSLGRTEKVL